MRKVLVPELTWPLRLSEYQLALDLVEITIDGIRIEGETTLSMVSLEHLNELVVCAADGYTVPLFNRPRRRTGSRPLTANIRTETERRNGQLVGPIFSGRLVAFESTSISDNYIGLRECVKIRLNLQLNVSRFLSVQSFQENRFRNILRPLLPFALAGNRDVCIEGDEVSFGCDGNVIMGSGATYRYSASKQSSAHLIDLLNAITETISCWLRNRFKNGDNEVICHPQFSLSKAEWYAEFRTHDPRRHVTRFTPSLMRQGRVGNVFRRRLTGQVRTFGKHSHAIQIELAKGIKQTTYPKTNRRIRFEMKYGRSCFQRLFGRRTQLTERRLVNALTVLRTHATRELPKIFNALNAGVRPANDGPTRDDLVMCIGHFTEHLAFTEEIHRSLRDTGRVVVENGSVLRPSIDALRRVGVLRYVRHSVYTVTDEFEAALRSLMAEPGAAMENEMRAS